VKAASLAGHWAGQADRPLRTTYHITIVANTGWCPCNRRTCSKALRGLGWHVQHVADGNADDVGRHHPGDRSRQGVTDQAPVLINGDHRRSATAHPQGPRPARRGKRSAAARARDEAELTTAVGAGSGLTALRGAPSRPTRPLREAMQAAGMARRSRVDRPWPRTGSQVHAAEAGPEFERKCCA